MSPAPPGARPGAPRFRIVTYNIHKCRGMDGRIDPGRIAAVLEALDADAIALQEVLGGGGEHGAAGDHAAYLARRLKMHSSLGENRRHLGSAYGNLLLSREAPRLTANYDLTVRGRERRGCLRADLAFGGRWLHIFNVHLGTSWSERAEQAGRLLGAEILGRPGLAGGRILLGDCNEWIRGPATRLLRAHLQGADVGRHLGWGRTYPGLLPLLHLDHIYFDPALHLHSLALDRSPTALVASDHLPLIADFEVSGASNGRDA